jgi:hypothetical protein
MPYNTNASKKEVVFHVWDEFMLILDLAIMILPYTEKLLEIKSAQLEKKRRWEKFYERKIWIPVLKNFKSDPNMDLLVALILKWEELVIESFLYLQEARKMGGTQGHKIGPIWSFQKKEKEKYSELLLKI